MNIITAARHEIFFIILRPRRKRDYIWSVCVLFPMGKYYIKFNIILRLRRC